MRQALGVWGRKMSGTDELSRGMKASRRHTSKAGTRMEGGPAVPGRLKSASAASGPLRKLSHVSGLDGLRAFAVVLTSLVHLVPGRVPGGIFGVDVFFVISGFLITSILLSAAGAGGIDLRDFYIRRVRRLLPAVVALLFVFTAVVMLSAPTTRDLVVAVVVDVGVMAYLFNWSDAFGHAPPWQVDHLWSLSVEEQFYLLWPVVLVVALTRFSRRQIVAGTAALAALSMVAQGVTFVLTRNPAWAYEATPLHASGILIGCLLAQLYTWKMGEQMLRWFASQTWPAWIALVIPVLLAVSTGVDDTFTYTGGMALAVASSAVLVATMAGHSTFSSSTPSPFQRLFSSPVMVAIGKRSYSLYLWQNFLAWALTPIRSSFWFVPANFLATAVAAELSYRFIERRFVKKSVPTTQPHCEVDAS